MTLSQNVSPCKPLEVELTRSQTGEPLPTSANIVAILSHDPRWKTTIGFDSRSQTVVWLREPPVDLSRAERFQFGLPLSDSDYTRIQIWLDREYGMCARSSAIAGAVKIVAEASRFDPLVNALRAVRWDGRGRLRDWLVRLCGAEDTPYTRAVGRKWLISAVARAMRPGCQVDTAVVLEGSQGCGKSSLLRVLGGRWYRETTADFGSKDFKSNLQSGWIVEISELAGLSKSERNAVKRELSATEDSYRPAYARLDVVIPRSVIFCGSTNDSAYLNDPTGARRRWPVRVGKVDLAGLRAERDQLLAEAREAFEKGEPWHFTGDEAHLVEAQREIAEEVRGVHPWEDIASSALADADWVTSSDLLHQILGVPKSDGQLRVKQTQAVDVMQAIGWTKTARKNVRGYLREGVDKATARPWRNPLGLGAAGHLRGVSSN